MPSLAELIRQRFEVHQEFGAELVIPCPSPDHSDTHPSCWVNSDKGVWICYSCGAGGAVSQILGTDVPDVAPTLNEIDRALAELETHVEVKIYPERWLDRFTVHPEAREYWGGQRGLSDETIDQFRLGYDPESRSATYPVRDLAGRVLGVVRRRLSERGPKYLYPSGIAMHDFMFGHAQVVEDGYREPCLVEGATDALAMWDAGVPALAQYGGRLSDHQIGVLRRLSPLSLTLLYDNDHVGKSSTEYAVDNIDFTLVRIGQWDPFPGIKDVADLDVSQRRAIMREAQDRLDFLLDGV